MIEQIDDTEKEQLESALKHNKHMEVSILNYFEYYPLMTPRKIQLSKAASICVKNFSMMSKANLYNTAILDQYHDGMTADVFGSPFIPSDIYADFIVFFLRLKLI